MLRFIAKRYAKTRYVFNQHVEGENNLLNAGLALGLAKEKRELVARLNAEADQMDSRIKEVGEMEERGYWLCERGHEHDTSALSTEIGKEHICLDCREPAKFIKRDQLTGQEKYESDKERKDAEDMAKQKRDQAKAEEENAAQNEKTAAYFRSLAENNRRVAEKVRRL